MNDEVVEASSRYRAHSRAHGAATESGDYKKANKHHDGVIEALRSLRAQGGTGRAALEEVATVKGIVGLSAQTVLAEFDKGTLELP